MRLKATVGDSSAHLSMAQASIAALTTALQERNGQALMPNFRMCLDFEADNGHDADNIACVVSEQVDGFIASVQRLPGEEDSRYALSAELDGTFSIFDSVLDSKVAWTHYEPYGLRLVEILNEADKVVDA